MFELLCILVFVGILMFTGVTMVTFYCLSRSAVIWICSEYGWRGD